LRLAQHAFSGWAYTAIAALALLLALRTEIHPIPILIGGGVLGAALGALSAAGNDAVSVAAPDLNSQDP
jgi:hypothetical protein